MSWQKRNLEKSSIQGKVNHAYIPSCIHFLCIRFIMYTFMTFTRNSISVGSKPDQDRKEEEKKMRKSSTSSTKLKGIFNWERKIWLDYWIAEIDPKKLMEETIKKHEAFQFLVKKRAANTERKISRIESLSFSDNPPPTTASSQGLLYNFPFKQIVWGSSGLRISHQLT